MTDENISAKLYAKMATVMSKISRLPKSGYNAHFKYNYATSEDVNDTVRQAMAEVGLAFIVDIVNITQESKKTTVEYLFTFADSETGATKTCKWIGEALDTQDKGISKATTSAVKYFLLKTFLISTGDEPDPDAGKEAKPKTYTHPPAAGLNTDQVDKDLGLDQFEEDPDDPVQPTKRPYTPEQLRKRLSGLAANHDNFTPSDAQIGLLRYALESLFVGDDNHEDKRHTVLTYLSGRASTKDTSGALWKAIVEQWTNFTKRDDGSNEYFVNDSYAVQEAAAIVKQALIDEGQTELSL